MEYNKLIRPNGIINEPKESLQLASGWWLSICNKKIIPMAKVKTEQEVTNGQGEGVTK
jgi:hypothetical protein